MLLIIAHKNYFKGDKQLELSDMYLFPGKSCFPLSPSNENKKDSDVNYVGTDDQLLQILNHIGKQDKNSLSFV